MVLSSFVRLSWYDDLRVVCLWHRTIRQWILHTSAEVDDLSVLMGSVESGFSGALVVQWSSKLKDFCCPGICRIVGIRAASQNANGSSKQSVGENFGGKLRLFIDTADAESWQRWLPSGAFYGKPVVYMALYFSWHFPLVYVRVWLHCPILIQSVTLMLCPW